MAKTCYDRYMAIIRIARTVATLCGADCLREDYKINWVTCMVIIAINAYFCCTIYTIYIAFAVAGNWKMALETLSLMGSAIQGYSKLIYGIRRRWVMLSMTKKLENIYKEYQKDEDYLEILRHRIDFLKAVLKFAVLIYFVLAGGVALFPLVYSQILGEKIMIMQFFIPGIDHTTETGHWIYIVIHSFLIFLGSFGNFAGDMCVFVFITHIPLYKDILKIKCKQFNKVIDEKRDPKERLQMLKDILKWHQQYNIYVQEVEDAYHVVIFVQIFTSVVGISCTLFTIIIRSWPAAFAYLIYSSSILYSFCGLGNLVDMANDEIIDAIYMDWSWYELSIPEQKLILVMLQKAQAPISLTVGHLMPLSMTTALQLTKAIYSYLMMLVNFLDDM